MENDENIIEARRLGRVAYYLAAKHALLHKEKMTPEDKERLIRLDEELQALGPIERQR